MHSTISAHSFGVMSSINLIFTPFSHFNLFLVQAEVRKRGRKWEREGEEADERRQQGRILALLRRMTEWAYAGQMIDENKIIIAMESNKYGGKMYF